MKSSARFCLAFMLLPLCSGRPVMADESLQLPDRYAEGVLRVEGMV